MRVFVVVHGCESEDDHYWKLCEFSDVPRKGETLSFGIGDDEWPNASPFGNVESVDWYDGFPMVWCDGSELWTNGATVEEITFSGWKSSCGDVWSFLKAFKEE